MRDPENQSIFNSKLAKKPGTIDRSWTWRPSNLKQISIGILVMVSAGASAVGWSKSQTTDSFATKGLQHPWLFEPSNEREVEHLEAADFLSELNFYEDGHGLVLPTSVTKERLTSTFGLEAVSKISGLIPRENGLMGVQEESLGSTKVLVFGCGACHIGKAAGRVIPGLGIKTADLFGLAQSTYSQVNSADMADSLIHSNNPDWRRAREGGRKAYARLAHRTDYDSGTAGVINQFFALEMAIEELGLPPFKKTLYAPVKVPSFWGYGPKREVGVFSDGFLKGSPAGSAGIPLFIGNYKLDLFQKNMDTYEAAERQFEKLLPPSYPFEVNKSLANRGQRIFMNNCVQCHGEHQRDQDNLPVFTRPKFISLEEVGTDESRANVYDDDVRERIANSSFGPFLQTTDLRGGYIAPNLWGIWSRFPYLHNGSVANIADLLTEPSQRPKYIDIRDIGEEYRFDKTRLGATPTDANRAQLRLKMRDRWVYSTLRKGLSNKGHDFGTNLAPEEKSALIEYLKTL